MDKEQKGVVSWGKRKEIVVFFKMKRKWIFILSFALPFFIAAIVFAACGVHPFGSRQLIVTDFWHQYYPIICEFRRKLLSGSSLLYTWNSGLGANFINILAYYCASPLNLLTLLVPEVALRDTVTFIMLVKIGCAGLCASICFTSLMKRRDVSVIFFSTLYALCAFMTGYYWNIMWTDSVALFPLVVLGMVLLVRDAKPLLYTISLAACLIFNYYIGFYICIGVVLLYPAVLTVTWKGFKNAFGSVGRMIVHSLAGGAISAFVLLPAFLALQNTYAAANNSIGKTLFNGNALEFLSALYPFAEPNTKDGNLPNICCGLFCLILLVLLLFGRYRIREKICSVYMLSVLMASFIIRPLDFYWNGGHYTNMIPFRYSFIFTFVLLLAAYRAYTGLHRCKIWQALVAGLLPVAFAITLFILGYLDLARTLIAVIGCTIYLCFILLYIFRAFPTRIIALCFCVLLAVECAISGAIGFPDYSDYPSYLSDEPGIEELFSHRDEDGFYRSEITTYHTLNDPMLYGYRGVSQFSSGAIGALTEFLNTVCCGGYPAGNRYVFEQTTPFMQSLMAVKYLVSLNATDASERYLQYIDSYDGKAIYENTTVLPVAFAVSDTYSEFDGEDCFTAQNKLFYDMTKLPGQLFYQLRDIEAEAEGTYLNGSDGWYTFTNEEESAHLIFTCHCPYSGSYYVYPSIYQADRVTITQADGTAAVFTELYSTGTILPAGYHEEGDIFFVDTLMEPGDRTRTAYIRYAWMDDELLLQGIEKLRRGGLYDISYSDTKIEGSINVPEDCGSVFTSIPYEKGWRAYVDGEEVTCHAYQGAFVSFPAAPGQHRIELKYTPEGFVPGLIISLGGIITLALSCLYYYLRRKRKERKNVQTDL